MQKRYQIFISSTYRDLVEERAAVIQAVLKLYHFPIGMEMFHADNEEQWKQIKNTILLSDYYVLILGRYCGTLIEEEGISYTEKEYDFALSQNIPVLSFVISDEAKKKSFGVESTKQQKSYKKFKKKVLQLPCDFWSTPDELAYKVTATLSMKFLENKRKGWIPFNPSEALFTTKKPIDSWLVGKYKVLYYSSFHNQARRLIQSELYIDSSSNVVFYNNIQNGTPEFIYHGICINKENILYVYLENDHSNEHAVMHLIKSAGDLHRLIGLFTALSSGLSPVCVKISCFQEQIQTEKIDASLLESLLCASNSIYGDNLLIIEETQKQLFFSRQLEKKPLNP